MKQQKTNLKYLWLIIPLIISYFAYKGYGFEYKAGVTISCLGLIAFSYWNKLKSSRNVLFVIAAFVFSIIGDWFLSHKGDSFIMFSAGIGFYFLAHAGYMVYALVNGRLKIGLAVFLLIAYLLLFAFVLYPAINDTLLLVVVFVYLLISCFAVAAAAGTRLPAFSKWAYFSGIVLILFSDTIIAFMEFTTYQDLNFLILPTYYAAHIVITFSLLYKANNKSS
ncbi:lysoplasmalogenase family protein [Maribellus luteus]|nr:lysoplasmalogenase family protein [Maribellus luteus]